MPFKNNDKSLLLSTNPRYSSLSNKRAGWNKTCRLENLANFRNFETLKLCRKDLNIILAQIGLKMTEISIFQPNCGQSKLVNE